MNIFRNSLALTASLFLTATAFGNTLKTVSTAEVQKALSNPKAVVVDTRLSDAFNGWAMDGLKSGGHIEGATDFSASWFINGADAKVANKALVDTLKTKGISKDKEVILYDSNGKDSEKVAQFLKQNGISNISYFDVKEWEKAGKNFSHFSGYETLVPASWVKENLKDYKIFFAAWGPEKMNEDYKKGHIPGTVYIDTDEIESPPLWSINSDTDLLKFAKNNGITKDDKIVVYSTNPMPSYRIAMILKYLGVKDVRVLNGGTNSWTREGYALETKSNPKVPGTGFGANSPINKDIISDIKQTKEILASPQGQLVDIRSWEEHIGKITGYSDLQFKGRPAGAIWGKAGSDPNELEEYRNIDSTMRNGNEILAMWKDLGIDTNKKLAFMCGSGWRAAEVLIYSKVLGAKNSTLYSNGWYEWSADKANPVETGIPANRK